MNAAVSCEGGERKGINTELWYACAGPLVSLPSAGSLVVYFPQGHSEQVAASMQKNADAHIPNYPNLPSKLICLLHNVTLHADPETDEVYAQMTLQPVNAKNKDALQASDHAPSTNRPQSEFFCKTLTASDTSTHGGFSVPRRAAEKIFPPLDFSMQPPVQELQAKDLHDNIWTFRHIYRGQPKRHLLTTGWSLFVSGKRLVAGDSVLFIRDEKSQLLLGIRRANKQVNNISSSVLSSDSMHIGVLAAAAHAAANNSLFTLFYNPRASPSEFVIPLAKYNKAIYGNHISLGMRFRMTFETEESGTRRYMGTITGISDSDPVRWKNSQWRNLQVGWDESAAGERRDRVSIWEIEPVVAPFFICPPPFFRTKLSRPLGDDESADAENLLKRPRPWFGDQISIKDSQSPSVVVPGMSLVQWMNMQQNQLLANTNMQPDYLSSITGTALQNLGPANISNQSSFQAQILQQNCMKINAHNRSHQTNQMTPISNMSVLSNQLGNVAMPQPPCDTFQQKHLVDQIYPFNQTHGSLGQTQLLVPAQVQQQQPLIQITQPPQTSLLQNQSSQFLLQQHHQKLLHQQQLQDQIPIQLCHQTNHPQLFEKELQLQQCQKLQQQPQPLPPQPILQNSQPTQEQQHLVKVSQCSPSSYSFPLQNTGSQQAANNTLVAMSLSHSSHKQTQKKPQQQLLEEVSEPTQEQKHLVHVSQGSSNSYSLPLQNSGLQQAVNNTSVATRLSHSMHNQTQKPQQQVLEEELPRMSHPVILHSSPQSSLPTAGVTQLEIFDDVPSCSRSPSTNVSALSQTIHNRSCTGPLATDEMPRSAVTPSPGMFEALIAIPNACKALQKNETKEKPLPVTSKMQSAGVFDPQAYLGSAPQMDFLDSSSSATSACLPQADGQLQENLPSPNKSSIFFRISASDDKIQAADPGNDIFGVNNGCTLDILPQTDCFISKNICPVNDCLNKLSSGNMLENYNSKEAQKALPKSYASQSFAVPDAAFSSIDSTINDCSFLNRSSRAPPQQKMRTYTKVYKRGAVGRSIDITRYSGYSELKEDLARMFGLGRELEDLQRIGWKLVYVDQENDVLLVGDDPWEEFVSCARCIRILSPQEVQQMSLDGDLDNNILPNQTCGSSDGGNMWRDQNPVNPSALPYDRFG